MAISANKLKTVRQFKFYSLWELGSLNDDGTSVFLAETPDIDLAEFASLGIAYPLIAAADVINGMLYIPSEADRDHPFRFRIAYMSASTTDADIFLFLFEYMPILVNAATTAPLTQANIITALDTIIPSDTKGAGIANSVNFTESGVLNGGTLAEGVKFLNISITATTLGTTAPALMGVELEYTPKWYKGYKPESSAWQNKN